jgi:hypothetical protein
MFKMKKSALMKKHIRSFFCVLLISFWDQNLGRAKKLQNAIKMQTWEDDPCRILQQLKGIGETSAQKLVKNNLPFNDIITRNAAQIDFIMGKQNSSFGSTLLEEISDIPVFQIQMKRSDGQKSGSTLRVSV